MDKKEVDKFSDKQEFRNYCLNDLRKSSKSSKICKDMKIIKRIEKIIKVINPNRVLFYLPLEIEADLRKLMNHYRKKCIVLVPFMEGVSFKMVKYRLPLLKKKFNIYESPNSILKLEKVDLIVVPVVGVCGDYKRIGYGKGMYDRFYENLKDKPKVMFVQIEKCYTKEHIGDQFDIKADYYITPNETIENRGKYNVNGVDRRRIFSRNRRRSRVSRCKKNN